MHKSLINTKHLQSHLWAVTELNKALGHLQYWHPHATQSKGQFGHRTSLHSALGGAVEHFMLVWAMAREEPLKLILININARGFNQRMSCPTCSTSAKIERLTLKKRWRKKTTAPYILYWRNKKCNDSGYSGLLIITCLQCSASISTLRPLFHEPEIIIKRVE